MAKLSDKLNTLPRIGPKYTKLLKNLGLETIEDLLLYLPFRYEDFRENKSIANLQLGDQTNIQGEITLIQNRRSFKRRLNITEALISDGSDTIKVIWFNQAFLTRSLKVGDLVSLAGKVSKYQGQLILNSPQYEKIFLGKSQQNSSPSHTHGLIPIYRLSAGLHQKQLRYLIKTNLKLVTDIPDYLPDQIRTSLQLLPLSQALKQIHTPKNYQEIEAARTRLVFSELFIRQVKAQLLKSSLSQKKAPRIIFKEQETRKFINTLPFTLSVDQKKAAWEILQDINKEQAMSRLLEGDVGSGKTIVAVITLFNVVLNQQKAAFMAPTFVLAQQHFNNLQKLFKNYPTIKIALLTSQKKNKDWSEADIVIGTHALIQKNINLANLALVVVDEQHRFGVKQRQYLSKKTGTLSPHFLSMTATPIPRSLALSIYGNLDLSIIKEMPLGRKKIITKVLPESARQKTYDFMRQEMVAGRQVFVICPLIDESDKWEAKSVKTEFQHLSTEIFPDFTIDLIHGQMKIQEKEDIMERFSAGKSNLLVSTSVVELGIDVARASVIVIEGAERFGLAQLHQFRGRVGRSNQQSYCFIFANQASERLKILEKYSDGFNVAKIDLKMRGSGDLFGLTQSGFNEFQLANFFSHQLIKQSSDLIKELITKDPDLKTEPLLLSRLGDWRKNIHLE